MKMLKSMDCAIGWALHQKYVAEFDLKNVNYANHVYCN